MNLALVDLLRIKSMPLSAPAEGFRGLTRETRPGRARPTASGTTGPTRARELLNTTDVFIAKIWQSQRCEDASAAVVSLSL
ncbi:hypothetical protein EVAR_81724_1 [Eumeta japonica]|uniref:Uncharacterized protein n=1 Tax=Eumeta variegata TaxID=151549 RepID=A0A4C1UIY6_EUMVA|nr:hypothetical protein EVAR_81724_1 [Eumeta japonica]